jgi:hypothetical protein
MKAALDSLYASFNYPESALDPIQIVRRYRRSTIARSSPSLPRPGVWPRRVGDGVYRGRLRGLGPRRRRSSASSIRIATAPICAGWCTAGRAATTSSVWSGSCAS